MGMAEVNIFESPRIGCSVCGYVTCPITLRYGLPGLYLKHGPSLSHCYL